MHREHVGNDSSGESSPWVGICVIDGHLPRVFHGLAPSPPPLSPSLSLSEQECENRTPGRQRRMSLRRTGVNN